MLIPNVNIRKTKPSVTLRRFRRAYLEMHRRYCSMNWVLSKLSSLSIAPRLTEAAQNRMELIIAATGKANYSVTERLKAENKWNGCGKMNACKAQADEIVKAD